MHAAPATATLVSPEVECRRRAEAAGEIHDPARFAWVMEPLLDVSLVEGREYAWSMSLASDGRCRRIDALATGHYDQVHVPLEDAIHYARRARVHAFVVAHSHANGRAWPSVEDAQLTEALAHLAHQYGMALVDHVVLGRGEFYSFREGGLWRTR